MNLNTYSFSGTQKFLNQTLIYITVFLLSFSWVFLIPQSANAVVVPTDNLKPTISFVNPAASGMSFNETLEVEVHATDETNLNRVAVNVYDSSNSFLKPCGSTPGGSSLGVTAYTFNCDVDTTLLSDGLYNLRASARDEAGNIKTAQISFNSDNTKPTATITSHSNGDLVSKNFTVSGTASDNLSGVDYVDVAIRQLDGIGGTDLGLVLSDTASYSSLSEVFSYDVSGLSDGFYKVKFKVYDDAGNRRNRSVDVQVDATKPVVNFANPSAALQAFAGDLVVETENSDNVELKRVAVNHYNELNNSFIGPCGSTSASSSLGVTSYDFSCTIDTTAHVDGIYTLRASARDSVDQVSAVSRQVIFDNTKPTASIDTHAQGQFVPMAFSVEVSANDATSSVDRVEYRINEIDALGGSFVAVADSGIATYDSASGTYKFDVSGLEEKIYRIRIFAIDEAGNSRTKKVDVQVDKTKPSVQITSPLDASFQPDTFTINGDVSDSASGVDRIEYKINQIDSIGGSWVANIDSGNATYDVTSDTFSFDATGLADGIYRLRVQAFDKVGNYKYHYIDVEVDTTAPSADAGTDNSVEALTDTLSGTSDDATATSSWTLNSGPGVAIFDDSAALSTGVTVDVYGTYVFELTVTDAAGNSSSDTVEVEFVEPAATTTPPPTNIITNDNDDPDQSSQNNQNNPPVFFAATGINNTESSNQADDGSNDQNQEQASQDDGELVTQEVLGAQTEDNQSQDSGFPWWIVFTLGAFGIFYFFIRFGEIQE